jgi:reverse gyrase
MSRYAACPKCGHHARGGLLGGAFVYLHKCRDCGCVFCEECRNHSQCPNCGSDDVQWEYDKAFPR